MLRVVVLSALLTACGSSSPKPAGPPDPIQPDAPPPREQVYDGPATPPTLEAGFHFDVVQERTDRFGDDETRSSSAAWQIEFTKIDAPQVITFRFGKFVTNWEELSDKTMVLTMTATGPKITDADGAAVPMPNYAFTAFLQNGTMSVPELFGKHLDQGAAVAIDGVTWMMLTGYPIEGETTSASVTLERVDPDGIATIAHAAEGTGKDPAGMPITWSATGTVEIDVDTWLPRSSTLSYQSKGVPKAHGFDLRRTYTFE